MALEEIETLSVTPLEQQELETQMEHGQQSEFHNFQGQLANHKGFQSPLTEVELETIWEIV